MQETQRILIVDDEQDILDFLSEFFDHKGFQPFTACDGVEALEIMERENFSLVLSDIRMPKMDGIEFSKRVAAIYPETPVVLVTGHTIEKEKNCDEVRKIFLKPIDNRTLDDIINEYLVID